LKKGKKVLPESEEEEESEEIPVKKGKVAPPKKGGKPAKGRKK